MSVYRLIVLRLILVTMYSCVSLALDVISYFPNNVGTHMCLWLSRSVPLCKDLVWVVAFHSLSRIRMQCFKRTPSPRCTAEVVYCPSKYLHVVATTSRDRARKYNTPSRNKSIYLSRNKPMLNLSLPDLHCLSF